MSVTSDKIKVTRQRIMRSTIALFNRKGVLVTVDEIVADAGVSKGTAFNYFGSKDKLLGTVFQMCHAHAVEITESGVDWDADVETVVKQLLRNSCKWSTTFPDEVQYTMNYHKMQKSALFDLGLFHELKGPVDDERIAERLRDTLPQSIPYEYFSVSISNQNYQFGLYLAEHPECRENQAFIDAVINWMWESIRSIQRIR